MHKSNLSIQALLALGLSLSACSFSNEDQPDKILLRVQGTVTSASDYIPVADALVILGGGGHFTFPGSLDTVVTNSEGHYRIERSITDPADRFGGCQLWLSAAADGFETVPRGSADSPYNVRCIGDLQNINIRLKPLD